MLWNLGETFLRTLRSTLKGTSFPLSMKNPCVTPGKYTVSKKQKTPAWILVLMLGSLATFWQEDLAEDTAGCPPVLRVKVSPASGKHSRYWHPQKRQGVSNKQEFRKQYLGRKENPEFWNWGVSRHEVWVGPGTNKWEGEGKLGLSKEPSYARTPHWGAQSQ